MPRILVKECDECNGSGYGFQDVVRDKLHITNACFKCGGTGRILVFPPRDIVKIKELDNQ